MQIYYTYCIRNPFANPKFAKQTRKVNLLCKLTFFLRIFLFIDKEYFYFFLVSPVYNK